MLRVVASAANEPEADLISARLREAGIEALVRRSASAALPHFGSGGARDVYVRQEDLERAARLLQAPRFGDEGPA
jgi:Putative prokaryotic signal transducing protein